MAVMTVLGPIDGDQLGVTLMHEHLLIDVSYKWQQPTEVTAARAGRAADHPGQSGLLAPQHRGCQDQLSPGRRRYGGRRSPGLQA